MCKGNTPVAGGGGGDTDPKIPVFMDSANDGDPDTV